MNKASALLVLLLVGAVVVIGMQSMFSSQPVHAEGEAAQKGPWTIITTTSAATRGEQLHVFLLNTATGESFMLRESGEGRLTWQGIDRSRSSESRNALRSPDVVRRWRAAEKGDVIEAQSEPEGPAIVKKLMLAIQEDLTHRIAKDGDGNVIGLELLEHFEDPDTGLKAGDIILKVDQTAVADRNGFFAALTAAVAKDGVAQLTVIREESEVKLDVTDR